MAFQSFDYDAGYSKNAQCVIHNIYTFSLLFQRRIHAFTIYDRTFVFLIFIWPVWSSLRCSCARIEYAICKISLMLFKKTKSFLFFFLLKISTMKYWISNFAIRCISKQQLFKLKAVTCHANHITMVIMQTQSYILCRVKMECIYLIFFNK